MNHDELIEDDDGAVLYFWFVYGIPEEVTIAICANCGWDAVSRFEGIQFYLEAREARSREGPPLLERQRAGRSLSPATGFFLGFMAEELLCNYAPDEPLTVNWSGSYLLSQLDAQLDQLSERALISWNYQSTLYSLCRDGAGYWTGKQVDFILGHDGRWLGPKLGTNGYSEPICMNRSKLMSSFAGRAANQMNDLVQHYNRNHCGNFNQFKYMYGDYDTVGKREYRPQINKSRYEK